MRSLIFFLLITTSVFSQDIKIEPPFWWVGMKEKKLQLLIHGTDVSKKTIYINKPGVKTLKITKAESPNYVFVDLFIGAETKPGDMAITVGSYKTRYSLKSRESGSAQRKGFDNTDIIYLITPDRFANGDTANDDITNMLERPDRANRGGRHGGDIKGIINHLDYIKEMGFTSIWPMPLLENNLATYTYHGYAISDFYKTDPRYGTNEDYRNLSIMAKSRGIKLIADIVLNHCGSGHWWMKDLPFKDWINYGGNYVNTNHRREANQDPHASNHDKELMQAGWFVPTMPDMNQRNPFMATYLIQNTIWWIEYAQLGGLRIDTYPYVDKSFSAIWSKAILHEYPNMNMVGEEWSYNPIITSYWQKGNKNKDGYISNLRSVFDFPLQGSIVSALNEKEGFNEGLIKIYQTLALDHQYADINNLVYFGDNHDMSRLYTQLHENFDLWQQAMVILMTMRGIPQVYYGTEVLITNPKSDDHGEIRADMPGGWASDKKSVFTKEGLADNEKKALELTKKLIHLRKSSPALQQGKLIHFAPVAGIYVYFRIWNNEKYMIAINKNENEVRLQSNTYLEVIENKTSYTDVMTNTSHSFSDFLTILGKGYKIVKL